MQNDTDASLIFSGITSDNTTNGSDRTPNCERIIVNEKAVSGSQLNAATSIFLDLSNMYTPKTVKPSAIPTAEIDIIN